MNSMVMYGVIATIATSVITRGYQVRYPARKRAENLSSGHDSMMYPFKRSIYGCRNSRQILGEIIRSMVKNHLNHSFCLRPRSFTRSSDVVELTRNHHESI